MPASRSFLRWCESVGWETSKSGTSSQTHTLPGVLAQHVDELQADRVAKRLGDLGHPLRLLALDVRVDDRLAAGLACGALLLRGELQIDSHRSTYID